jgi:sugar/nucleoside kinase (ribokinase family)
VGRLSSDQQDKFRHDLELFGISAEIDPCPETGGFGLIYDERGDRTLDILGVADPIRRLPARLSEAQFILIGPILGETPLPLVQEIAAATVAPIILDPQGLLRRIKQGRVDRYRNPEIDGVLPLMDVVKANEYEAEIITGFEPRANPTEAVTTLYELMARERTRTHHTPIAIVTLAEAGSLLFDGDAIIRVPAYATDAIDPTGAGDTYAGGFMVQYLNAPEDLRRAGYFASATASVMVENSGPDFPLTLAEANRRTDWLLSER